MEDNYHQLCTLTIEALKFTKKGTTSMEVQPRPKLQQSDR